MGRTVICAFGGISHVASHIEDGAFDGDVCGAIGASAWRASDCRGSGPMSSWVDEFIPSHSARPAGLIGSSLGGLSWGGFFGVNLLRSGSCWSSAMGSDCQKHSPRQSFALGAPKQCTRLYTADRCLAV